MILALALLIGVVAGLRALTAPAAVSWAAHAGLLPLAGTPLAFLGHPVTPWILTALALAELVADQLPSTPSRKVPVQFGARLLTGALAGAAIYAAWAFFGGGWREPARKFGAAFPGLVQLARDKFRVDELYDASIVRPVRRGSQLIFSFVDRIIIDRILVAGSAAVVDVFGRVLRAFKTGDAQRYMAAFAIGAAALVVYGSRPHADVKIKMNGANAEPWANTRSPPNVSTTKMRGTSQYFLRRRA